MAAPVPFTAVGAACLRAAHLTEDGNPKIFQDTLVHALVGCELATLLENVLQQSWPPEILLVARVAMVTRARYTDNRLQRTPSSVRGTPAFRSS
jgi:O-methyltransferase involved in polyketide biosynthesis